MDENYIVIDKNCGYYSIDASYHGYEYPHRVYWYYTKRDAIRLYRETYDLKYKHLKAYC